jgi:hypothetical protein
MAGAYVAQDHGAAVPGRGTMGTHPCDSDPLVRTRPSQAPPLLCVYAAGPCGAWLSRCRRPTHAARAEKPRCSRPARRCGLYGIRMRSHCRCLCTPWRRGTRGQHSRPTLFSVLPRQSKAVMACCRNCITISEAYQNGGTRCGRCCITSIAVLQMGRRPPRGFSAERFQTSLKRCYHKSRTCHGLGDALKPWRSLVDAGKCPLYAGTPHAHGILLSYVKIKCRLF